MVMNACKSNTRKTKVLRDWVARKKIPGLLVFRKSSVEGGEITSLVPQSKAANGEHHRVAGENVSIKTRVMATPVHAFVRQLCYRA
jgi:hypothetical protein